MMDVNVERLPFCVHARENCKRAHGVGLAMVIVCTCTLKVGKVIVGLTY